MVSDRVVCEVGSGWVWWVACGVDGGCGGGDVEVVVWCVCVWVVGGVVVVVEGVVRVV